jgi:uncharacterized protein YjbI with pentapeptide repeats
LKIKETKFLDCVIKSTDFINIDLSSADFSGSDLQGSRFHGANLGKARFSTAFNYVIDPTCNQVKQARFSAPEALALLVPFGIKLDS